MNSETLDIIPSGTSAGANYTSEGKNGEKYGWTGFQLIATSLDASDGVIKLQDSVDNINWNDISGATITVSSAQTSNMIRYTAFTGKYIRAVWTKNTVSTGTLYGKIIFKEG